MAGRFRFKLARAIGDQHQLKLGQRPPAEPFKLVQRGMAAGRIVFAGLDHDAARARHVHSPRHRFFIDRQVMKKRVLAAHCRTLPGYCIEKNHSLPLS